LENPHSMKQLFTLTLLCFCLSAFAQNTVGLLSHDQSKAFDGYNLHFPHNQGTAYLLNNCGEIVHLWEDTVYKPGNGVIITDDGELAVLKGKGAASNAYIHAGGGGELVEIRDWDNNITWSYTVNDSLKRLHHDFDILPNGNALLIVWEKLTYDQAVAAGRDSTKLTEGELWPDYIIEVEPNGLTGGTIVWEWHAMDHVIQDFDATKANFGVVEDNPELIDLNYDTKDGAADWMHTNSLNYNEDLDQILLSVPHFDEIWIIDHSTTTAQAAGNVGGASGQGGDLIFRWGNPKAFGLGDSSDQKLFFNHDAHWMDIGLNSSSPSFGKIMVFNNRRGEDYSSVITIAPTFDTYEWEYTQQSDNTWFPEDYETEITHPVAPQNLYSTGLSSAQRLPNGNTLIMGGRQGYAFELDEDDEIVWEYVNPMLSGNPVAQGTILTISQNLMFRFHRYGVNFAGFDGRDLSTSLGYIELDPDTTFCSLISGINDIPFKNEISVYPNPATSVITLEFSTALNAKLEIYDITGRKVYADRWNGNIKQLSVLDWAAGTYSILIDGLASGKIMIVR
jgi:hypothetical protein